MHYSAKLQVLNFDWSIIDVQEWVNGQV